MRISLIFILIYLGLSTNTALAQVNFGIPDTVCSGELLKPVNQSQNINSYLWHFCSANMSHTPTGVNMGNTGFLNEPTFIALAEDNGNYYSFVSNLSRTGTRNIIRNRHNKSLANNPLSDDLGNISGVLPNAIEGIQIVQDAAKNWYGFVVGGKGYGSSLIRLSFGLSLDSFPKATNIGNYNMNFPEDLTIVNDNGVWKGFTINYLGNSMTRFVFTNGLNLSPDTVTLLKGTLKNPWGLSRPVKENGRWYMFITSDGSTTLKRLDFGTSLSNVPTVTDLDNSSGLLKSPRTIRILHDCEKTYGLVANQYHHTLIRLEFSNGIAGPITYSSLGNIGGISQPQGMTEITRADNDIFVFISNINNNTLTRLQYDPCTEPSVITSTDANPSELFYSNPGTYNVNLVGWKDSVTKECTCKNITVLEKPEVSLINDTTICPDTTILLDPVKDYTSYLWNTHSREKTIIADTTGTYQLIVSNGKGCKDTATFHLDHYKDNLFLGNDTSFTLGQSILLNAGEQYTHCYWSTGESGINSIEIKKPGVYAVLVKDFIPSTTRYCTYLDTIVVNLTVDVPNFFTPNGDGVNDSWSPNLFFHYPEAEIYIYDRFGKQVAHFRGDSPGWDGSFNNRKVDTDSYWYVIDLKDGTKPIRGSITVKTK